MNRLPNFFLVGAPKAGTTAFLRYLEQHPSVFVSPIKEPGFFAPEILDAAPDARGIVREWHEYLRLFEGVRSETAIGEGTVAYLAAEGAASRIHDRLPQARILMILRDPADRLRAYWGSAVASGVTRSPFAEWIKKQVELERGTKPRLGPVWTGFYANDLQRYLELFGGNVKPILYDDYVRDPNAVLSEVFRFLAVDPDWKSDVSRRHNVTLVPRWPRLHQLAQPLRRAARIVLPEATHARLRDRWRQPFRSSISASDRKLAIDIYRRDIESLASILNRDLSSWLE